MAHRQWVTTDKGGSSKGTTRFVNCMSHLCRGFAAAVVSMSMTYYKMQAVLHNRMVVHAQEFLSNERGVALLRVLTKVFYQYVSNSNLNKASKARLLHMHGSLHKATQVSGSV